MVVISIKQYITDTVKENIQLNTHQATQQKNIAKKKKPMKQNNKKKDGFSKYNKHSWPQHKTQ